MVIMVICALSFAISSLGAWGGLIRCWGCCNFQKEANFSLKFRALLKMLLEFSVLTVLLYLILNSEYAVWYNVFHIIVINDEDDE